MNKIKRVSVFLSVFVVFIAVFAFLYISNCNTAIEILSLTFAFGGLLGLLLQLKDSKDFNEGSFITQLNDSFNNNEAIQRIYRKLQMNEPISDSDTPDIVAYLTYFETVWVLLKKNILDFDTLDNLFSYRFFLAVTNPDIQRISLIRYDSEYINLYMLEKKWSEYAASHSFFKPSPFSLKNVNPNYELLTSGKFNARKDTIIRKADKNDAKEIHNLMKKVFDGLEDKTLFVCDNEEYVLSQLTETGFGVVAEHNGRIIGSFIARYPDDSPDNLGIDISLSEGELPKVVHFESIVVDEEYRGNNLQQKMILFAEGLVNRKVYRHLLATVSPANAPSLKSFEKNGFSRIVTKEKYNGLKRTVMYKKI